MKKSILILGIGNDILKDDGIGIKIIEEINKNKFSDDIEFKTSILGGFDVLEIIQDYKKVILIDAIKTKDGVPGDIYYFKPSDFKETLHLSNIHDISFLNAIKLGKKLRFNVPKEIHIIAIEILEDRIFGDNFTPELKSKFPKIVKSVKKIIKKLTKN